MAPIVTASPASNPQTKPRSVLAKTKRQDDSQAVMETNSSSIVSKRSVEHKFYAEPHFLRYFVNKRKTRAPLINRGYWLRMKCIESTVRNFCHRVKNKGIVINLGAGFDALPFRLLSLDPKLCQKVTFVDVDYDELIETKVKIILAENKLAELVGNADARVISGAIKLKAEKYWAIGCDLHAVDVLEQIVSEYFSNGNDHDILLVSEVATCYMSPGEVDELIRWASNLRNTTFCLLEQHLPAGPEHPFAKTMLRHFVKVRGPLKGISKYVTINDQISRFSNLGWGEVSGRSLWQIWCTTGPDAIITTDEKDRLENMEPFDEWEELALFACHYFLLIASSTANDAPLPRTISTSATHHQASTWVSTDDQKALYGSCMPHRRFGAFFRSKEGLLAYHGGHSTTRTNTTILLDFQQDNSNHDDFAPAEIQPRLGHTITTLNDQFDLILVGGRASPTNIFSDCWVRYKGSWERSKPLPFPLYRHCATKVYLEGRLIGILVYGGITSQRKPNSTFLLWVAPLSLQNGEKSINFSDVEWEQVAIKSSVPLEGRYAATMAAVPGKSTGLLVGGLGKGGVPASYPFICWTLGRQNDEWKIRLEIPDSQNIHGESMESCFNRFGASLIAHQSGFAIIGGIGGDRLLSQDNQTLIVKLTKTHELTKDDIQGIHYYASKTFERSISRLLVGHAATSDADTVFVYGGGAICFSFGAVQDEGGFQINNDGTVMPLKVERAYEGVGPRLKPSNLYENNDEASKEETKRRLASESKKYSETVDIVSSPSAAQFTEILRRLIPAILRDLDFGPCINSWNTEHLIRKVGAEKKVSIHKSEHSHMSFQPGNRNFEYVQVTFAQFMESVSAGGKEYFRALSDKDLNVPANIELDFPELASEFRIPLALKIISENLHSSVLRISGPVSMWLHYDVMANVLVQVRGTKRLILFPPSDVSYLRVPSGSSTSSLDASEIFDRRSSVLLHTHPYEVVLEPGEALFIPPLWLHCAAPTNDFSVAVNVFFRNLDNGYAAGRDAYGNRDVQAYEDGRRDIAKIVNRFKSLPAPMTDFYLRRLRAELDEHISALPSIVGRGQ